ncbi:MAG: hypothetical protein ABI881_06650 [Betaproteobacteria bacterium]
MNAYSSRHDVPLIITAALACAMAPAALACSSCGCTLSSNWGSQGAGTDSGSMFDLRFDYFNQDDLRSGRRSVDRGSLEVPNDTEIQQTTINRNYTLNFDHAKGDWGVNVQLPWYDRYHTTIAEGDTDRSTSHSRSFGDARVLGRYQGFSDDHSIGVQAGLKFATGPFHETFISGPQAGEPLDRGLQPGTGTTDLLLGAYNFGSLSRDWDCFAEALLQIPIASREHFKPGAGINANAGLRYMSFEHVVPQVQLNLRSERRESGASADVDNSGATLVYLSPGVTVHLSQDWRAYAFFQVPVYQRVNGLQIEPRYTVSLGVSLAL